MSSLNAKQVRQYCLNKPEVIEDFPFGDQAAVFKVAEKMFALIARRDGVDQINLKCDPNQAFILRDLFAAVIPGYHMNKTHWNTVLLDGSIPRGEIERMIDHSFALVVKGLTKAKRQRLELQYEAESLYGHSVN